MNGPVFAWLLDAATIAGLVLFAMSACYGLALLLFPATAVRIGEYLNARYTSPALQSLEKPHASERFFYRHHRTVAVLLLAGVAAFYGLYFFDYPHDSVIAKLAHGVGEPLARIVADAAGRFFLVANGFIAVFALVMLVRPSALKPLEGYANRWLSARALGRPRAPVDRFASRYPRLAGVLVLAGTGYVVAALLAAGS